MKNTVFYIQHYLSPSMTFIYRQLIGVSKEFSVDLICSRKIEKTKGLGYDQIYYFPPTFFQKVSSRLSDRVFHKREILSHHINPKLYTHQTRRIKEFLLKHKTSLIHANFGSSGIEILPIAKELDIPLIVSFHGYDGSQLLKSAVYKKNLEELLEYAFVITPSQYMLNNLSDKVKKVEKSEVLHYGIPLEFFEFIERESPQKKKYDQKEIIFLQVSNFVEKKGHEYTIKAFKAVVESYPGARLILAGEGNLKKQNMLLAKQLGIEDKIIFPGYVNQNQVKNLMNNADIFVHHSVTASSGDKEGIPNVIMEAMATGLPAVSTLHAGIPELIEDGKDGYLVQERDITGYSEKLLTALNNDGKISFEARKKIESEFNLKLQNEKIKELYSKIIRES